MRYFDLHCDTIGECLSRGLPLRGNGLAVDLDRASGLAPYVQCYAVWLPDELRGEAAFRHFCDAAGLLDREVAASGGELLHCRTPKDLDRVEARGCRGAVLTVENGSVLGGRLERVQDLKDRGVAMLTLTWNGENELGRGVLSPGDTGPTPFGRQAVKALERAGIVVDVSHASPELFWDVAGLAERPIVASHSNAKAVCGHPRNLTKEQFLAIRDRGGLVGAQFLPVLPERLSPGGQPGGCAAPRRVFPGPGRGGYPGHGQRLRRGAAPGGPAGGGGYPRPVPDVFGQGLPRGSGGKALLRQRRPVFPAVGPGERIPLTEREKYGIVPYSGPAPAAGPGRKSWNCR